MNNKIGCLIFFFFGLLIHLNAQSPFKASLMTGVNLSQVDGDMQTGYTHKGINFGIRGGFSISKRLDIMSELFYQEKGVKDKGNASYSTGRSVSIDLKYAEIPITINYHSKENAKGFYHWTAHAGFAYSRLLNAKTNVSYRVKIDTTAEENLSEVSYKPHELTLVWGLSYNFHRHIGIRFQHSFSLSKFYINPLPKAPYDPRWNDFSYRNFRNYFVSLQLYYDFFAPKKKAKKGSKTHAPQRRS
jgi:Outer membrane protein beta-barrel domain